MKAINSRRFIVERPLFIAPVRIRGSGLVVAVLNVAFPLFFFFFDIQMRPAKTKAGIKRNLKSSRPYSSSFASCLRWSANPFLRLSYPSVGVTRDSRLLRMVCTVRSTTYRPYVAECLLLNVTNRLVFGTFAPMTFHRVLLWFCRYFFPLNI